MHQFVMIAFMLMGLLFVVLSIPLILRKIPPNWMYGVRLPKTQKDPNIWYPANEYGGKWMAAAGVVMALASLGLGTLRVSDDTYAMSMLGVMMASLGVAVIAILIYVRKL